MNRLGAGYCEAAGPGGGVAQGPPIAFQLWPLIMIGVIFYMLVFRPQRLKQKELEKMISALQKGDSVVTSGGLLGIVMGLKERTVVLKIAENVRVEILRSSITNVEKTKSNSS